MRHRRHKKNIDCFPGCRLDAVPQGSISLLCGYLSLVELPVLVYRNRRTAIDEALHVWEEGLAACAYSSTDIFAAIGGVIFVLIPSVMYSLKDSVE